MADITAEVYAAAGLSELGRWLRDGRCTAAQLAELSLAALTERAQPLNAVVTLAPERARAEAAAADRLLAAGLDAGPLHGLPYGAKDLLATGPDLPTSWGAAPLRAQTFDHEATVIRRLRAAGAVLAAKLAMVELAGGVGYRQPNASLTGPGRNPWQPDHWTGGSSSGSGAAVAVGALPYAIGSETWGSILLPAAYCGIVGLRPTYGLVSRHGAMALSWTMDKIGPLARSVADCAMVLAAIAGADPADPASAGRQPGWRPARFAGRRWRIGVLTAEVADADPAVGRAVADLMPQLATLGEVVEVGLPDLPYAETARLIISAEAAAAFEELTESGLIGELTAPEDRVTIYAYGTILARDYLRAQRLRGRVVAALADLLDQVDVLIAPTAPTTASPIDQPLASSGGRPRRSALSAASNLAGLPAISLPIGLDEQRLPIGLQIVADAFAEEALLAAAMRVERLIDWPPAGRWPAAG